jgi:ActR/RegA family two-component response regulator
MTDGLKLLNTLSRGEDISVDSSVDGITLVALAGEAVKSGATMTVTNAANMDGIKRSAVAHVGKDKEGKSHVIFVE